MGDSTTELAREIVNQVLEDSIFKSSKPAVSSNGAVETPNKTQEGDASEEPTAMPSSVNKGKQKSVEPEQRMSEEISKEIPPQKPPTRAPSPLPAPPAAYAVKTIQVDVGAGSFPCPILVQNENGPCPLLALCNILLLRRQIRIPAGRDSIAHNDLVGLLGDAILNQMHSNPIQGTD